MTGFINARIDYRLKGLMQQQQGLEYIWRGSPSRGAKADLFTKTLDEYGYCTPWDFDFEHGYEYVPVPGGGRGVEWESQGPRLGGPE